jgi:TonB family protein
MAPRFLVRLVLVAGCAQAGVAPQHPGRFTWTYDNGVVSAGHRRQNPQPLDTPNPTLEPPTPTHAVEGAVRFCVGPTGSVTSADTEAPTGDATLDQTLRDTVRTWTFRPAEFGGLRVEACATAKFVLSD